MYFIARNNKIYHYIAHTKPIRRHCLTFGVVCALLLIGYFAHSCIKAYVAVTEQEYHAMQHTAKEVRRLLKNNEKISQSLATIHHYNFIFVDKNVDELSKKRLLFVFENARHNNLEISSYGEHKEKSGQWYKKELAHCDFVGSLEDIMQFLETIKKSHNMVTVSQWSLHHIDGIKYRLACDVGFVFVI